MDEKLRKALNDMSPESARACLALMRALRPSEAVQNVDDLVSAIWCQMVGSLAETAQDPTEGDDLLPSEMWARHREQTR